MRNRSLNALLDRVMERRAVELVEQVGDWVPAPTRAGKRATGKKPLLDIGSGTGHLAARLEQKLGLEVVTSDVSDLHVVGRPPVIIADGVLPFEPRSFSGALLIFMLHYPGDPAALLREAARVTGGSAPVIVVQSLHANRVGYAWLRVREFFWTWVAFHVTKAMGYVPPGAKFTMNARRFYTRGALERDVASAGLRVSERRTRAVLPGGALVVAAWRLEHAQ